MVRKILEYVVGSLAILVLAAVSSALLYRKYLQYKVSEARAIHSSNGIVDLRRVHIGGIDQFIEVRGQDVNNPVLLFLHGGPGIAFIPLSGAFQTPWEKYFTVVQWDQRGAGKTYAANDNELLRKTMTVAQMEQDALEVVNYLRNRFRRDKIFVLGHSWGSVLGLWLALEHPEAVYAYVGTGQVVSMRKNDEVAYKEVLQQARLIHNDQAVKDLEGIAPYPPPSIDLKKENVARYWQGQLLGPPPQTPNFTEIKRILSDVVSAPQYSLLDDLGFVRGMSFSIEVMVPQMADLDLGQLGLDLRTPVFFFEGRHDAFCPSSLIWEYSQDIKAPRKGFVWFEGSGHFPFYEEPQKFTDELARNLWSLAGESSSGTPASH
jgi:pimeloyl-ACP methyl ester carboxylesterase